MIGKKVVLRVRMSARDAHYAGELVNGSRILDFWGDVGTELMIRNDGDESLFISYKDVEFLAPVYSGDFMEYHGWIEERGGSSRVCKFEAYKVIELAKDDNLALSAANVLEEPVLCGRATGTLVVRKPLQRGAQDEAFK
ncbi:hotdog fold domain-containing protein [Anaerosalibacter massiliensis]|uniref:Hotdog fold thioesterase n=1 Tax=Anaerosalibacter massiliensis TaxID=1347392 RepID=A0A9X2S7B5_9FIRM|nr:hotdog fold domain-containing protein [Anaerosalibacter massiliensis]MCR2044582.1 hotdog fold thioesterase [Anaerosalibacter massiliensis]